VPNLVGDRAEGGRRRWGGSGSYRQRWRRGVLRAGVAEGGEGGAGSLQRDDVVLLVPLVGVKRPCTGGSTGGRAAAE
jgi:hypothetical protein